MSGSRRATAVHAHTMHLHVRRTARVVFVGEPSERIRQVWLACHGYGQLAPAFAQELGALAAPDRLIVVPEALNRYYLDDHGGVHGPDHPVGATWMTREERLTDIDDYCAYLDTVYDHVLGALEQRRVVFCALGFSQGAATVARWAAHSERPVDHLVLWGAGLPDDVAPAALGSASLTLVVGQRDRYAMDHVTGRLVPALQQAGTPHAIETFAGGHRLDDDTLQRLAARFG